MNKVFLIGNVVRKPEIKRTRKGVAVTTFHVITDRQWVVNGEEREESTKHVCVAWDRLAEVCEKVLDKGSLIYVDGRLETKTLQESEEGFEQTSVVLNNFILLSTTKAESTYKEYELDIGGSSGSGHSSNFPVEDYIKPVEDYIKEAKETEDVRLEIPNFETEQEVR